MDLPTQPEPLPRWADRTEVAAYLGISTRTVNRLAASGQITAHPVGQITRYNLNEIDALFLNAAADSRAGASRGQ